MLAFADAGAFDSVLPKSALTEYLLEATSKPQSGVGFKRANGSHIKHYGKRRFRVKTSAGSNKNTTWEVADVRKPLISVSRLLERGHKLVLWTRTRGYPVQEWRHNSALEDQLFVRRAVVDSDGFSQAGLNTNRIMKRELVRPHTEGRTRNAHAGWPVTEGSVRAAVDMGEPADPDGLGEEVTDTARTARVLAAPRTPTKTEREDA